MDAMKLMIGADIGKRNDPSAIAIAIAEKRSIEDRYETHYNIPYLRRLLPLGQPYPEQAKEIIRLSLAALDRFKHLPGIEHYSTPHVRFFMDVTGVGDGMVDLVKPVLRGQIHLVP